jgi:hypothetical protein
MLSWVLAIINLLLDKGGTIAEIIAVGRANGMTAEEEAIITDGYNEMEARRKKDAGQ